MAATHYAPRRRLPPEAAPLVDLIRRRLRPTSFGGALVCSLDWRLGSCWPRFVLPPGQDVRDFDLRFVRGIDVLIIFRPGHSPEHVAQAVAALIVNGARTAAPCVLPHVVKK